MAGTRSWGAITVRFCWKPGSPRAETRASTKQSAGSLQETRLNAAFFKNVQQGEARTALAEGWVAQATIEAMMAEIDAWAQRPDAFSTGVACHNLAAAKDYIFTGYAKR